MFCFCLGCRKLECYSHPNNNNKSQKNHKIIIFLELVRKRTFQANPAGEEEIPDSLQADKNSAKIFNIFLMAKCGLVWEYKTPGDQKYKRFCTHPQDLLTCLCRALMGKRRPKKASVGSAGLEKESILPSPALWERHKWFGSHIRTQKRTALSLSEKGRKPVISWTHVKVYCN